MQISTELALRKFVAPEFIFGAQAGQLAGRYARNLGARRVLLVTDPGVIAAGWAAYVGASLDGEGLPYTIFSNVTSNPRAEEVMSGAEVYRAEGCDVIVAVGGGSPIDCAKGIGIVSTNRRHVLEFEGVDRVRTPMPPLICIPTTGGTSADVSQFAIILNPQERVKIAIISKALVPDVALIDPCMLTTMPPDLTAYTGVDALVHAIESFVSSAHSPITDLHALEAIRLITANLPGTIDDPGNMERRSAVMLGSLAAGLAFSNASLGAVHAMAHSLGGLLDLPHGACNAMLLRHTIDFNFAAASERYVSVAEAMGVDLRGMSLEARKAALLAAVDGLLQRVGITSTLASAGMHTSDIPALARHALRDPCIVTNPCRPVQRDLEVIYEHAL